MATTTITLPSFKINGATFVAELTIQNSLSNTVCRYEMTFELTVTNPPSTSSTINANKAGKFTIRYNITSSETNTITFTPTSTQVARGHTKTVTQYFRNHTSKREINAYSAKFTLENEHTTSKSASMTVSALTKYTVTYNTGGIGTNSTEQVSYGYSPSRPDKTAPGFTFYKWYTDSTFRTPVNFSTYKIYRNTIFYGNWREHQYILRFNANGGESILSDRKLYYREQYILPDSGVGRVGYTLVGWNTEPSGEGITFNLKANVCQFTSEDRSIFTLYAMWEKNE